MVYEILLQYLTFYWSAKTQEFIFISVRLWFVIRNMYLPFVSIPGTEFLKTLNFLSDKSDEGVLIFLTNPLQLHLSLC